MNQKNRRIIIYIMAIWFLISFVTNIIGPLIPIIIKWYKLNYALAGFLPFSFFLAYGIISIPAGFLLERRGQSVTMTTRSSAGIVFHALFGASFTTSVGVSNFFFGGAAPTNSNATDSKSNERMNPSPFAPV